MRLNVTRKTGSKIIGIAALIGAAAYGGTVWQLGGPVGQKPIPKLPPPGVPPPVPVPGPGPVPTPRPVAPRYAVGNEIRSHAAGWWKYRITSINYWNYAYLGDRTDYFGSVALVNYAWAELEKPDYYKV